MNGANTAVQVQILITVIPIVGIVIGGIVAFFYLLWRHREITLQIKNNNYEQQHSVSLRVYALLTGILLTGVGIVISFIFILMNGVSYQLLGGLIPLAIGICLLVFYKICPTTNNKDE